MSDTPQPPAPSGGLPPALANLSPSTLGWAQAGGAAATIISTFLPWVSISAFGVSATASLFDASAGKGILVLLLGLAVGALGFFTARGQEVPGGLKLPPWTGVGLAALLLLLIFIWWIDVLDYSGFGAWLGLIGALVAFGASLLPVLKGRRG